MDGTLTYTRLLSFDPPANVNSLITVGTTFAVELGSTTNLQRAIVTL